MSLNKFSLRKIWGVAAITALYRDAIVTDFKTNFAIVINNELAPFYTDINQMHLLCADLIDERDRQLSHSYSFINMSEVNALKKLYRENNSYLFSLDEIFNLEIKSEKRAGLFSKWRAVADYSLGIAKLRKKSVIKVLENMTYIMPAEHPVHQHALEIIDRLDGPKALSRAYQRDQKNFGICDPR